MIFKIIIFIFTLFSPLFSVDFCETPAFEDEFEDDKLSSAWEASRDSTFSTSASLFSPTNVNAVDGELIISLNNIGTTDNKGVLYRSTSGEISSTIEFGYGRYEFRILTAGLVPVIETLQIIWFNGDYDKDHQFIGFEFVEKGFTSLLAINVSESDEVNTYHNTEIDNSTSQPKPSILNLRYRFFTIEYTEDSVTWIYDGSIVRQETTATKEIPDKKMKVLFRNWLINELKYNLSDNDMPVESKIDFFKFTPVDEGGKSCDKIKLPKSTDSDDDKDDVSEDSNLSVEYEELKEIIEDLEEDENHLIGFSGKIDLFSVFKSARVVWVYIDEKWKAYSPYSKIRDTLENHNIEIIEEIPPFTGFWIQK